MLGDSLASGFGSGTPIQGHKADVVGLAEVLAFGADRTRTAHGAKAQTAHDVAGRAVAFGQDRGTGRPTGLRSGPLERSEVGSLGYA